MEATWQRHLCGEERGLKDPDGEGGGCTDRKRDAPAPVGTGERSCWEFAGESVAAAGGTGGHWRLRCTPVMDVSQKGDVSNDCWARRLHRAQKQDIQTKFMISSV
eukprot:1140332-Pelagomonas_calceolata.AAC.11